MKVFYSRTPHGRPEGERYQNPRHFMGVVEGATEVTIDGDYPEIERAYAAANVSVVRLDGAAPAEAKPKGKRRKTAETAAANTAEG